MSKEVLIPIATGIEEIETMCLVDVLRRAGANVTIASVHELEIKAAHGITFVADCLIAECESETYDLIVLPGGLPGAEHLRDSEVLTQLLKAQKATDRLYGAICASPAVVLAHHGLLNDVVATCYPSFLKKLPVPDEEGLSVVVDKNCVTSQGPGTALIFAFKLVGLLYGEEKVEELSEAMLVSLSK